MFKALLKAVGGKFSNSKLPAPNEIFVIDFFTQKGELATHGTMSLSNGLSKSTWTIGDGTTERKFPVFVDEEMFRDIWDFIGNTPDLGQFQVLSSEAQLDFRKNFVIGIVFDFKEQSGQRTYLVPHTCQSTTIMDWILKITALSETQLA
ncbi:hypothetical protein [Undibacterium danionis]|uniref:Uncharacterized protein n=1 Tax=Undibacterium danionis TaxID=1812100 RepID=A0ABV6IFU1_9BURK